MSTSLDVISCECDVCRRACSRRVGWFLPGEVAKAAELKGMTEKEFFDRYVGVDWYHDDERGDVFVLAPANVQCTPGQEYPYDPFGACVLYTDGRCEIHAAKPHECLVYDHRKANDESTSTHLQVADAWRTDEAKEEVRRLLGRDPVPPEEPDLFEMLKMFM